MKVGYFGLPLGAHLLLRDGHELDPCVLSPLEAPGRRRVRARLPAARLIDARGRPASASTSEIERALSRGEPELIVSWFWTRLLPASLARGGALGRYRSPSLALAATPWSESLFLDHRRWRSRSRRHLARLGPRVRHGRYPAPAGNPRRRAELMAARARARPPLTGAASRRSAALRGRAAAARNRAARRPRQLGARADRPAAAGGLDVADRPRFAPNSGARAGSGPSGGDPGAPLLRDACTRRDAFRLGARARRGGSAGCGRNTRHPNSRRRRGHRARAARAPRISPGMATAPSSSSTKSRSPPPSRLADASGRLRARAHAPHSVKVSSTWNRDLG